MGNGPALREHHGIRSDAHYADQLMKARQRHRRILSRWSGLFEQYGQLIATI